MYTTLGTNLLVANVTMVNPAIMFLHMDAQTAAEVRNITLYCDWRAQVQLAGPHELLGLSALPLLGSSNDLKATDDLVVVQAWADERKKRAPQTPRMSLTPTELQGLSMWAKTHWKTIGEHVPMLPFNTDGVDPGSRSNGVWVHNLTVENFDDVVAVKPCNGDCAGGPTVCTQNILVEQMRIFLGVGLSVGSMNPKTPTNCIKGVIFRHASFQYPFKAIYIKSNSGDDGDGIMENITYSDISIRDPFYLPIYIGPQQQKEPNGVGDGFWPATQPLVTIKNITLRNIVSKGGPGGKMLLPHSGLFRCNASNPCTDFTLENVKVESLEAGPGGPYICDFVSGQVRADTEPKPTGGRDGTCEWS
jgi:polygalacturonase